MNNKISNKIILGILFLFAVLLIDGCTKKENIHTLKNIDGTQVHYNKRIPSKENLKITTTEIFTLSNNLTQKTTSKEIFTTLVSLAVDCSNNLYLLDKDCIIRKYNHKGEFLNSFGRQGNGPGELIESGTITALKDTIFVTDTKLLKVVKFKSDGTFLNNITNIPKPPRKVFNLSDSTFLSQWAFGDRNKEGEMIARTNINILDNRFNEILTIDKKSSPFKNMDVSNIATQFTIGNGHIYIGEISDHKYKINVYNLSGDSLSYVIINNYRKVQMNEEEFSMYSKSIKNANKNLKDLGMDIKKIFYKKAINGTWYDSKYNYLLVNSAVNRNEKNRDILLLDVFHKGVYMNKITLNIGKGYDFASNKQQLFFKNGRIYLLNTSENTITVYKY